MVQNKLCYIFFGYVQNSFFQKKGTMFLFFTLLNNKYKFSKRNQCNKFCMIIYQIHCTSNQKHNETTLLAFTYFQHAYVIIKDCKIRKKQPNPVSQRTCKAIFSRKYFKIMSCHFYIYQLVSL